MRHSDKQSAANGGLQRYIAKMFKKISTFGIKNSILAVHGASRLDGFFL
jgi:hypothetical protein